MFQNNEQIILKLTRDCNLRCKYCYIKEKDRFKGERLSFESFKKIINRIIKERVIANNNKEFQLVFHGGEPTLSGPKMIRKMADYAINIFDFYGINLKIALQTNLTLLDDEFCRVFKDYDISVGCSFDGFGISNSMRTSNDSTKAFIEKLELMKRNNVKFGYLTVVNSQNYKHAIKNTLKMLNKHYHLETKRTKNEQRFAKVNIVENILTDEDDSIEIDGEDYFNYILKPGFQSFLKKKELSETNTEQILTRFIQDRLSYTSTFFKSSCGSAFCGSGKVVISVSPDGNASLCGRFSDHFEGSSIGNVYENDFLELKQLRRIIQKTYDHNKHYNDFECDSCFALPICTTGCEAFHYSKYKEWGIREKIVCNVHKPTMKWLLENEYEILKEYARRSLKDEKEKTSDSLKFIRSNAKSFKKLKKNNIITKIEHNLDCRLTMNNNRNPIFVSTKRSEK